MRNSRYTEVTALETVNAGKRAAEADVCRHGAGKRRDQGCAAPKTVAPSARRAVATELVTVHQLSIVQACDLVGLSRTAYYRST